ncbi:hypothetical protein DPMN_040743 [Dreissena polymorpha]|uniref:Uncharacterized protein n=1 Tax=Dreissena polymorpha TaxID=45954 RepID=A0A9D4HVH1_DREPO|nr:hypothetical protein DPMN_040743 [Dreissena polymorpha]
MTEYQKANREFKKKMKGVKLEWIGEHDINLYKEMTIGSSKKAYITLKIIAITNQPKASVIAEADGNLLSESAKVLTGQVNNAVKGTTNLIK